MSLASLLIFLLVGLAAGWAASEVMRSRMSVIAAFVGALALIALVRLIR